MINYSLDGWQVNQHELVHCRRWLLTKVNLACAAVIAFL